MKMWKNTMSWMMAMVCGGLILAGCDPLTKWGNEHPGNNGEGHDKLLVNVCSDLDHPLKEGWIFCDDFESDEPLTERYFEYPNDNGEFIPVEGEGRGGGTAMRTLFQEGEVSAGNIKKSLGRTPDSYIGNHAVMPEEDFDEIYWRMDVRLQEGWIGGGGEKLTRATAFAKSNWSQGMIAHIWSGGSDDHYLVMDPASGVDEEGNLVSTRYNDFDNLRWLGAKRGTTPLFSSETAGRWFSVEAHVKLNTPGESDGVFEFWVDGELQAASYDLNWHGNWNEDPENYMINAIFIENYWNGGSPATQERYIDNFIISTKRIGDIH